MLAHWGLSLSDRIVLASLVSDDDLGVYSLGYQAASFLGLLFTAVNWTAIPRYAKHQGDLDKGIAALRPTMVKQASVTLVLSLLWIVTVPATLRFIMPDSFRDSAGVVPWVTVGYCLLGLYYVPANILTLTLGDTRWLWIGTVVAAVSNVTFNLAIVPSLGIQGAAIGTAVAYGVLLGLTSLLAVRSLRAHQASRSSYFELAKAA
jgi:O-antigen/teichoic acid export membrane protein